MFLKRRRHINKDKKRHKQRNGFCEIEQLAIEPIVTRSISLHLKYLPPMLKIPSNSNISISKHSNSSILKPKILFLFQKIWCYYTMATNASINARIVHFCDEIPKRNTSILSCSRVACFGFEEQFFKLICICHFRTKTINISYIHLQYGHCYFS